MKKITTPLTKEKVKQLSCGDSVLISGTIYTARDAAHQRLVALLEEGKPLPFELQDAIIYYVGPTPPKPGEIIGSAGPTTSYRMDSYTPPLLSIGLSGMIGKGKRSQEVVESMQEHQAVYFGAIGGAGAILSKCIQRAEVIAYDDLGAEAVRKLEVVDFPVFVVIDWKGKDLYTQGQENYLNQ